VAGQRWLIWFCVVRRLGRARLVNERMAPPVSPICICYMYSRDAKSVEALLCVRLNIDSALIEAICTTKDANFGTQKSIYDRVFWVARDAKLARRQQQSRRIQSLHMRSH
jgi:hypothetical protein